MQCNSDDSAIRNRNLKISKALLKS